MKGQMIVRGGNNRQRHTNGRTDGQTDGPTDIQTDRQIADR